MAGGRKGRRKPGQGEPGQNDPRDGTGPQPGQRGRESAAGTGDAEAEQWLNPFRIGRPVTPVISSRRPAAGPPGTGPAGSGAEPGSHGSAPAEPIVARPVYAEPVQVEPMRSDMPRQVWHDAEPPGQIWHDPEPGQDWQQPAQLPPPTLRLNPGEGYEPADGEWPNATGYQGGYGPAHDDQGGYGQYTGYDPRGGRQARRQQRGPWAPPGQVMPNEALGPGGLPIREPRRHDERDGDGWGPGPGYGPGQAGGRGSPDGYGGQASFGAPVRPDGRRRPDIQNGPPAPVRAGRAPGSGPPGNAGSQGGFGTRRRGGGPRDFAGQSGYGPDGYGGQPSHHYGGPPSHGFGGPPEYGYDGPNGNAERVGYDGPGGYGPRGDRFGPAGSGPDTSYGPGRAQPGGFGPPDGRYRGSRGRQANGDHVDGPGYGNGYGPPNGRSAPAGYGRAEGYGGQTPHGVRRRPGPGGPAGGFQVPGGQVPRREWRPGSGGPDGYVQGRAPEQEHGWDRRAQPGSAAGHPAGYGHAGDYPGGQGDWQQDWYDAPAGYRPRQQGQGGGFHEPGD
ncbi:MAG: hypothetical protein LBV34_26165, partial [Nocardiopsaceae bacterium]|nr:hypothetical protein [Nocardiopsaceae bacterium]